jgi:FeS assembly protein IscX
MQIYICIIRLTNPIAKAIIFTIMAESLNWETSYAVALALREAHPGVDLEKVSLQMIFTWTIALAGFNDDPALANDDILLAIYQDWYEEIL